MPQLYPYLFFYFLISSAFFSAIEAAYLSLDRISINRFKNKKSWWDRKIAFFIDHFDLFFISLLFFNLFNNIMAVWTARGWMRLLFPELSLKEGWLDVVFTLALTAVILIFCEINPKRIGIKYARPFAYLSVLPMLFLFRLFYPVSWITRSLTKAVVHRIRDTSKAKSLDKTEFLSYVKKSNDTGGLKKIESDMLKNLMTYKDLQVKSVLIPRYKVDGFDINRLPENLPLALKKFPYSTVPVYESLKDNIVGVLSKRKLFFKENGMKLSEQTLKKFLDVPRIVPETKGLIDVLADMDEIQHEICLVTDEYGGLEGIATYVDIIRKLLGKSDNWENDWNAIQMIAPSVYSVKSEVSLSDFNDYFNTQIQCQQAETIGGYLIEKKHAIPKPGQSFSYDGFNFTVRSATKRKIGRMEIRKLL